MDLLWETGTCNRNPVMMWLICQVEFEDFMFNVWKELSSLLIFTDWLFSLHRAERLVSSFLSFSIIISIILKHDIQHHSSSTSNTLQPQGAQLVTAFLIRRERIPYWGDGVRRSSPAGRRLMFPRRCQSFLFPRAKGGSHIHMTPQPTSLLSDVSKSLLLREIWIIVSSPERYRGQNMT